MNSISQKEAAYQVLCSFLRRPLFSPGDVLRTTNLLNYPPNVLNYGLPFAAQLGWIKLWPDRTRFELTDLGDEILRRQ